MLYEGIAAGAAAAGIVLWCRPRQRERQALEAVPPATRLRLHVPLLPWRDDFPLADRDLFGAIRRRSSIGAVMMLAIPVSLWLAASPREAETVVEPTGRTPRPMTVIPESLPPTPESVVATREPPSEPPAIEITPEELAELRTPMRLYGTAKVKPVYRLHDVEGALITKIDPRSFWAMLGVQEGDVVVELHGDPVDDPADLVALMNVLEREEHVALRVRGTDGEVRYLEYRIPREEHR